MTKNTTNRRLSPTLVKGAAFVLTGILVLAVPNPSRQLIRFVMATVLLVMGGTDLWSVLRGRERTRGALRSGFAVVAGVGLFLTPTATVRVVELVFAAYLAALAFLAIQHGFTTSRKSKSMRIDFGQGVFLLASTALIVAFPNALLRLALVSVALTAILVGAVMVAWALRNSAEDTEVADRAIVVEVVWKWLAQRDVGPERRSDLADRLFFEQPDRAEKITSYVVMLMLSVTIASLAILQDSTAVVIGAMLVAPLMTPIMACAVALVAGWRKRVAVSMALVAASTATAIGLAWVLASWIPAMVPLVANSQVLSRAAPTLLDMAIALAAGAAGAYATIDYRVSSSLPGVAIAVALVPPLGVVGVCLEAQLWQSAVGAFLLFLTNLVSIILASMITFVLVGLAPVKSILRKHRVMTDLVTVVVAAALVIMVPLALTGQGVLKAAARRGATQEAVNDWLDPDSSVRVMRVSTTRGRVHVMLTGSGDVPAVSELESAIVSSTGEPTRVTVEFIPSMTITADTQKTAGITD